jgi:pilus assembly protein CpaB
MRIVIFGLAFGSAIMAGLLAKGVIGKKPDKEVVEINKVPETEILVAAKDLLMGEKLAAGTVVWKKWPKANVLDSMITSEEMSDAVEKLADARARFPMYEGETILEKKILQAGQTGFMSSVLPKGMRAISVSITEASSAGGFILPNDRVDVILTRKLDGAAVAAGAAPVQSETVITNVRVLAINQTYRQEGEEKVAVEEGKTATLELDPRQAEVISMVGSSGEISLALRSIAEMDGRPLEENQPKLSDKYDGGPKRSGTDLLVVRYGIETYAQNR